MNNCQLTGRVAAAAAGLVGLGVRHGEQVLLLMPDGPGFIDAFVAVLELDAVPLPANPMLPASDVAAIAAKTGARLMVWPVERIGALADLKADPPVLVDGPEGPWAAALRLG